MPIERPSVERRTAALVAAVVALLAADPAFAGDGPPAVGAPVPHFRLPTVNEAACGAATFSTRAHVGPGAKSPRRALVVSFAASYCAPCRKELPALGALAARLVPAGVAFAIVIVDREEAGQAEMQRLVAELALPFPAVADTYGIVARRFGAETLPYAVVVDAAGVVRWLRSGYAEDTIAAIEAAVAALAPPAEPIR